MEDNKKIDPIVVQREPANYCMKDSTSCIYIFFFQKGLIAFLELSELLRDMQTFKPLCFINDRLVC